MADPVTGLSEEERLEWEAEKYSNRTLSVRVLSSGRVIICQPGLDIAAVLDPMGQDWESLYFVLETMCKVFLEEYLPPRQREQARSAPVSFSPEELAALDGVLSGLKIDL